MHKILIILPSLGGGGAEKLHLHLANDWIRRGFSVDLALVNKRGELLSLVPNKVNVFDLNVKRLRESFIGIFKIIKVNNYDVIISALWPLSSITIIAWLLTGKKGRLYVSEHNHLSLSCVKEQKIPHSVFKIIISLTHRFATGVIAVSKGVRSDLALLANMSEKAIKVIYNPAATGKIAKIDDKNALWGDKYKYHILSVGKLKKQKNYENLIRAFSHLPKNLNAKLIILGEGQLRKELEKLIIQLGLEDDIALPGFYKDPTPWFSSADLFVLSSQWEGFGNVIVEALECGVPVVSTDCPSGPAEILDNGRFGRLVPVGDSIALSNAMRESLFEEHDTASLKARAKEFSVEKISNQYLEYCRLSGGNSVS